MIKIRGSKRPIEKVLVALGNTDLPTDGTNINGTGGVVNLTDGQVGLLDVTPGSTTFNEFFNNASALTFNDIPVAKVVQGTDYSANPGQARIPFTRRPYESSVDIIGKNVYAYYGQAYAGPYNSASTLAVSATPLELSKYSIYLGFRGRRVTEFDSGIHAVVKKKVEFNTPEYSTLGLTSDQDHLVKNLAYQINLNSAQFAPYFGNPGGNWRVLAFAVSSTGAGTGVALNAVVGTSIPVVVTPGSGTQAVTMTQELFDTFAQVVANTALTNSSEIQVIDPSNWGVTNANADYLLIVAMNEVPAYIDRDPTLKIRIDAGAGDRFEEENINFVKGSDPFEGQGTYRQWKIYFENTNGQRSYSQNRDLYPVLVYPTSLDSTATYAALILEHYIGTQVSFTGTSVSPHKTIILVPSGSTAKANILAAFNNWLSPAFPAVTI